MGDLSVLVVTRGEAYAEKFIRRMHLLSVATNGEMVIAYDGDALPGYIINLPGCVTIGPVRSRGYIESVLDEAVGLCSRPYILRLDDDEVPSEAMMSWLIAGRYREADHWKFPRMNLWGNGYITNPPLWPDHQTRLSVRAKSGGRRAVHAGSPFGGGELAPCAIEHHKFLVKDYAERRRIAEVYDAFHPGYGTGGMLPFSLPEDAFENLIVEPYAAAA